jgi:hypothetical protein
MEQALRGKPALIAVLLVERPMCLDCISEKMEVSTNDADRCLTVIGTALELRRTDGRCQTLRSEARRLLGDPLIQLTICPL